MIYISLLKKDETLKSHAHLLKKIVLYASMEAP